MNYKKIILALIILFILTTLFLFLQKYTGSWTCENSQWVKKGNPKEAMPEESCAITSFEECVLAGNPVMESYPRQCRAFDKTFVEDIGNELEKLDLIRVDNPRPNQSVESPLVVEGWARGYWFFEASFLIKLFDQSNNLITEAIAQAQSEWTTEEFVPFRAELNFDSAILGKGLLVLEKDNPSGLPENSDQLRIPVIFDKKQETIKVKVYFNNDKLDPEFSCNKVFPVNREIAKTPAVARAALTELLKGLLQTEKDQGFFSSINERVIIQSLIIKDGIARADFNDQLEYQVGGSCRVSAIRAQITETLKQFQSVGNVIISINGRTEDILQP